MTQVLCFRLPSPAPTAARRHHNSPASGGNPIRSKYVASDHDKLSWITLQQSLKCNPRFSCLFSNNRKQEEARKALEGALGGKKSEFEKWDKEIRSREDAGGGGNSGGGWFRWFGGSNGDHFWQEAQHISLTILVISIVCLIAAKGNVMLAAFLNPLLFVLRGSRNGLTYATLQIKKMVNPTSQTSFISSTTPPEKASARENVVRKWGNS